MRPYSYVAFTEGGAQRSGTVLADSEADASAQLRGQGLYVSDLVLQADETAGQAKAGGTGLRLGRKRLSAALQMVFTRQMAVLLGAEMPLDAALATLRTAGGGAQLETTVARAQVLLREGEPLSRALDLSGAGFPPYYLAAVQAGERAGELSRVFDRLATHLETTGTERARIGAALVYPAFVAAVSVLVAGVLFTTVAPEIIALFRTSGRPLPALTQAMLSLSEGLRAHGWILLAGVGVVSLGWLLLRRLPAVRAARDGLLLRLPPVGGLMRSGAALQYLRTLALVLEARHTAPIAVDSAAQVLTVALFRQQAETCATRLRAGEPLSSALEAASFVPPVVRQLLRAGEVSARLAQMAGHAAALVDHEVTVRRKRLAALLEPALMMLVGAMVLVIVLSVLLPIFDLQAMVAP